MEFSENVTVLEKDGKTYYIIGTAHISHKSVEEVNEVIEAVQPDTVCVELCETRYKSITDESVWKKLDIFEVIKQGKTLFLLAHLALSAYQKRMAEQLGIKPGAELMAAVAKAEEVDAELVLADRDVQVTLKRTWGNLSFWGKLNIFFGLLVSLFHEEEIKEEDLENLKEKANLSRMLQEFAEAAPDIKEPLIDERDKYLISSIEEAPGEKIVAVVGAGHVEGMVKHFGEKIDREEISKLPEKSKITPYLKWIIPAIVVAMFGVGYYRAPEYSTIQQMLIAWILPNAIFCMLLTLIAGGKFLSSIVGFIASPITSLNPAIGAGMVVGFVEAWLRRPTVEDAEKVSEVKSIGGVYKNSFTRVLFVAMLANMGSALGAWIGISWLVTILT